MECLKLSRKFANGSVDEILVYSEFLSIPRKNQKTHWFSYEFRDYTMERFFEMSEKHGSVLPDNSFGTVKWKLSYGGVLQFFDGTTPANRLGSKWRLN